MWFLEQQDTLLQQINHAILQTYDELPHQLALSDNMIQKINLPAQTLHQYHCPFLRQSYGRIPICQVNLESDVGGMCHYN